MAFTTDIIIVGGIRGLAIGQEGTCLLKIISSLMS